MRKNRKLLFIITIIILAIVSIAAGALIGKYYNKNIATTGENNNKTNDTDNEASIKEEETKVEKEDPVDNSIKKYSYSIYSLKESTLSNDRIGFWFGRNKEFKRPNGPLPIEEFKKYNSYFIGDDKKVIYLTFDEGLNNTQANKNMDTLKKYNIKGTFFVTKGFIEANPDIVKRMRAEGHIIGNHTWNHKDMSVVSAKNPEEFIKELSSTEDSFKKITGTELDKVLRFPEGTFSLRALDYANQLGYRSIFWSFAYKDWDAEWNTRDEALSWMKNYYHPGAIYLLHGVNKANAEALEEFITYMKNNGYSFDVITNI